MTTQAITHDFCDLSKVKALAIEAFPPEEYLAPATLIEMAQRDEVDFLGLYDDEQFVGFMVIKLFEELCYLFFLAIDPALRSHGYGRKALHLLEALYPNKQQVVDLEMLDESSSNSGQRKIRRSFYLRNGYHETGKFLSYLGVDYEILCKDAGLNFDAFQRMMKEIRIDGFHPVYFERTTSSKEQAI